MNNGQSPLTVSRVGAKDEKTQQKARAALQSGQAVVVTGNEEETVSSIKAILERLTFSITYGW